MEEVSLCTRDEAKCGIQKLYDTKMWKYLTVFEALNKSGFPLELSCKDFVEC